MRPTSLQKPCIPKQPPTVQHVQALSTRYGLAVASPRTSNDPMLRRVVWIVEDWAEMFDQPVVPWSTVIVALASEDSTTSLRTIHRDYCSKDERRRAAEWFLRYVLEHLAEGSGLVVVRLIP